MTDSSCLIGRPAAAGPVNIHEVLEHVRSLIGLEFAQGLTIERDYDISAPAVFGDRGRFTQVFLNLARNAAEAMTEGRAHGTAVIIFKTRIARDVMLAGTRTRTALRIDVVDNGPGVPGALEGAHLFPVGDRPCGGLGPRTRIGKDLCGGSRRKHYARKPSRPDGLHGTAAAGRP